LLIAVRARLEEKSIEMNAAHAREKLIRYSGLRLVEHRAELERRRGGIPRHL
jgi:hypothetical protein